MPALAPGSLVGRYRIDSTIATDLYEAFDTSAQRTVVLKVLAIDLERARRFAREARAIVTIREIGTAANVGGRPFVYAAMERVNGKTLRQRLHGAERISLNEAIDLLIEVAEAIAKVHGAGIGVGGLDAEKIVVDQRGQAKLLDFTLAGDPPDDVHAFGDILHEVVTGRRPFRQYVPAAPRELAPTINRCLARDTTMTAVVRELEHARALGGAPPERPPAWRARLIQTAILIAAFVALVIVARRHATPVAKRAQPAATETADASAPGQRKIIAVLPFDNLGPSDDAWFAAGITDEIAERLAAIHRLGVISRTSSAHYAKSVKTIRQIGKELGADYVLQGTVRWRRAAGARSVRVMPRLVRVADDTRLWSAQYDRLIGDVFKLQSEIANRVLRELHISIGADESAAMHVALTENFQAYQAYLRAQGFANHSNSEVDARSAVEWFERAAGLDPRFAAALARLSMAHSYLVHAGYDRTPQRLELARAAVDRALALDPELPLAHMALGYFWYWGHRDYEHASAELALAWKGMPNNADVLETIGLVRRRKGDFDQALEDLTTAQRLDPQNRRLLLDIGQTYLSLRRFDEAAALYDQVIALAPSGPLGYAGRAETEWMKGSTERVKLLLAGMKPNDDETTASLHVRQSLYTRDYEGALRVLKATKVQAFLLLHVEEGFTPKELLIAQIEALRGNADAAKKSYETAREVIAAELARAPDDARLHSALGLVYAGLGDATNAVAEGQRAVELLPVASDALSGPERTLDLAKIYAAVGEKELAIAELGRLLTMPSLVSPGILRLDPAWDSLRDEEGFRQLSG